MNRMTLTILGLLTASVISPVATAVQTGDSVNYNFTGRLIEATYCTVNNDRVIDVPFGNVGINKLTGGTEYVKDISWTLDCGGVMSDSTVQMVIRATPESWDTQAMSSSVDGLGVQILKDGTPVDLNTAISLVPGEIPALQAKLVTDPATTLAEQPFTATGTLMVEYF